MVTTTKKSADSVDYTMKEFNNMQTVAELLSKLNDTDKN